MNKTDTVNNTDMIRRSWDGLEVRFKACFFTCLAVGVLTHFYMISNKITNLDDVVCVPDVGGGAVLGRWLQQGVHMLFTEWANPAFNGIMAIILLAVSSCFIISVLDIKSVTGAVLTAIAVITIPSVASNMYFMYLAPTFALAILMSVIGVYLASAYRFGSVAAIILQVLSMACYQAYFGFAASLYVLILLLELFDGGDAVKIVKRGVKFLITICLSVAVYLISLRFTGEELSDYKGLSNIGHTPVRDMFTAALRTFHRVLQYFVTAPESYAQGAFALINRLLAIVLIILVIMCICRMLSDKDNRSPLKILLLVFLLLLQPFTWGLVYLMAPELSHASTVMTFSYVSFDLMIIALSERIRENSKKVPASAVTVLLSAVIVLLLLKGYAGARVINIAYYRSYIAQERMVQYYSRIFSRLEAEDGYQYGDRVALLGSFYPDTVPVGSHDMDGFLLEDLEGATKEDHLFLPSLRTRVVQIFLGIDTPYVSDAETDKIMSDPGYRSMPAYPEFGCIRRFGDIWAVKLAPDGE